MKKLRKEILLAVCCAGILALGCVGLAQAQSPVISAGNAQAQPSGGPGAKPQEQDAAEIFRIWGPVIGIEDDSVIIDNQSGISSAGEIVLHIDPEHSRVLDAVNGYPIEIASLQKGEVIYAYIGPAMTMSLPPQTTAEMIIGQIPADFKVPDYVQVKSMEQREDGNWKLTGADGTVYSVPADCQILPYLTRNIVTLADVNKGSTCLVWSDEAGNVQKIVLFAADEK